MHGRKAQQMYSEAENGWMLSFSTSPHSIIIINIVYSVSWIVKRQRLLRASLSTYHHASCDQMPFCYIHSKQNNHFDFSV